MTGRTEQNVGSLLVKKAASYTERVHSHYKYSMTKPIPTPVDIRYESFTKEAESAKVMSSSGSSVVVSLPVRAGLTTILPELLTALAADEESPVDDSEEAEGDSVELVELPDSSSFAASVGEALGSSGGGSGEGVGSKVSRLSSCINRLASQY